MMIFKHRLNAFCCALLAGFFLTSLFAVSTYADGVVGNGTPASCTEAALDAALAGAGTITFNCGPDPWTVILTSEKLLDHPTTIDGGGKITLSGKTTDRVSTRIINVYLPDFGGIVELRNITLTEGYADNGGAVFIGHDQGVKMENVTIQSSHATLDGGAIYVNNSATLTLKNVVLYGNTSSEEGGAIYNHMGTVDLTNVRFDSNVADGWGGGMNNEQAVATLKAVTFVNNRAGVNDAVGDDGKGGGGIDSFNSVLTVTDSLFESNHSYNSGGGLRIMGGGTVSLTNVTLSGNSAQYSGGGILNYVGAATLTNVTLRGNTATTGGGIRMVGLGTLRNTLLAGNVAGNCYAESNILSVGNNLSSDDSCIGSLNQPGDKNSTDPLLGALQDNGGPTWTHLPGPGSPAIDTGSNGGCPAADQRGVQRPQGAACDIGAVEVVAPSPTATPTPAATALPSPVPTGTATPVPTGTVAPVPTGTATPVPTGTPIPVGTATPTPTSVWPYQPAPVPGSEKPSIAVNPGRGYAGQTVAVRGQTVATSPGVRVVWVENGMTILAAQATRDAADNSYVAQIAVPDTLSVGPTRVCAQAIGVATPAFACADFTVDKEPSGQIGGRLPLDVLPSDPANRPLFKLLDKGGSELARAQVAPDGSFQLADVTPGFYNYAVSGLLRQPVDSGPVKVGASRLEEVVATPGKSFLFFDPVSGQDCTRDKASIASVDALYTDHGSYQSLATPGSLQAAQYFAGRNYTVLTRDDFGTYVAGFPVPNNRFSVQLQQLDPNAKIDRVEYHILLADKRLLQLPSSSDDQGYPISYDVGDLPPGRHSLYVSPVVGGVRQCPYYKRVTVIPGPAAISRATAQDRATSADKKPCNGELRVPPGWKPSEPWKDPKPYYVFSCILPPTGSGLPVGWPDGGSLPILGNIRSEVDASFALDGWLSFAGYGAITKMEPYVFARLLGDEQCNYRKNWVENRAIVVDPFRPDLASLDLPQERVCTPKFHRDFPVPIWFSFKNKAVAHASVFMNLDGKIDFSADVQPFAPHAALELVADVTPNLGATFTVDFLVVGAGAELKAEASNKLDAALNTDWKPPYKIDACTRLYLRLTPYVTAGIEAWGIELIKRFNLTDIDVANYDRCLKLPAAAAAAAPAETTYPRVMAAPSLATASDGRMLSVYVEDTEPAAANPAPRVLARFWNPATQSWGESLPISGDDRAVNDPVPVFFGPNDGSAMVAWAQTEMTIEEEKAATSLNDLLSRLEIYYAIWNGTAWSSPARLTNDLLADGRPAIAGDVEGVSLAWTRNLGGATADDYRVALMEWNASAGSWGAMQLLSAGAAGGLNYQVSLDRKVYPATNSRKTAVAWVYDADGDVGTGADRRIALAARTFQAGDVSDWVGLDPQPLPPRVAMPSVRLSGNDESALKLAFLADTADANTAESRASFSQVWTADIGLAGATALASATALTDEGGQPVTGERPAMLNAKNGETLVVFRRFGGNGSGAGLGQLAASRSVPVAAGGRNYAPPAALANSTGGQLWQAAAAINPLDNSLRLLAVQRGTGTATVSSALGASQVPGTGRRQLSSGADPVVSVAYLDGSDPALDPTLTLSRLHAPVGSQVVVTATGRNLGRQTTDAAVRFFRGAPGSGVLAGEVAVPAVQFNQPFTATFTFTVATGAQPIYAQVGVVSPQGSLSPQVDLSSANDVATGDLSALPPPGRVYAGVDELVPDLVMVTLQPADAEGVAGYRLWRSTAITGTYDLVAETAGTEFVDAGLGRGQTYCFRVQAFDDRGFQSVFTAPVCTQTVPYRIYLPVGLKAWQNGW